MTQVSGHPARTRAQISGPNAPQGPLVASADHHRALLTIWVAYATVRVFMGSYYWVPAYHYLTPFYSPCVSGGVRGRLGQPRPWFPALPSIIPYAIVSLPFLLGFRLTCYYYRTAYYRAFWLAPAGLRGPRAARDLHRRDAVPADLAEPAPVLLLRRAAHLARSTPTTRSSRSTARTAGSGSAWAP